jgi:hypothetical protein
VKFCGYILAFYLILLAAVPCCVIDNCPDDKTEQTTQHEEGDGDCGTCSPFFNCESCITATTIYEPCQFQLIVPEQKIVYPSYLGPALLQAAIEFWQPPKLG